MNGPSAINPTVPEHQVSCPIPLRGKVSSKWSGIAELMRTDSPMAKGLEDMLAVVDLPGLRSIASSLRDGQNCTISEQYTCGAYNLVYEIVFDDGVTWIARMRSASSMQAVSQEFVFESPKYKQHVMASEVATMKYVREHTNIPVPEVYAFDTTSTNPAKLPYILMECIHGWRTPLKLQDLDDDIVRKILDQMAHVLLQLSFLQFPKIGYLHVDSDGQYRIDAMLDRKGKQVGPFSTALEYYRWRADQPLNRSNDSVVDFNEAIFHSNLFRISLAFLMDSPQGEGSFPLAHNDLGIHNMLFDEAFNLVGVIDWTGACVLPWESFAQFPGGVNAGPYLRHEFSDHMYRYYQFKQHAFLESLKAYEEEKLTEKDVSVYKKLGSPLAEVAQCMELYDLAYLRDKYRRKLCRLLFGPDVEAEVLKRSISKSELFGGVRNGAYTSNGAGKSSDFENDSCEISMGGRRNVGSRRRRELG